jgi:hypothetical protein
MIRKIQADGGFTVDNNMKSFVKNYPTNAEIAGLIIGDKVNYNDQLILVTNITQVFVENGIVSVKGYGVLAE